MDNNTIWRWILIGVLILVAIQILKYVIGVVGALLHIALTVAVVVGIIWLLVQVLSKRSTY